MNETTPETTLETTMPPQVAARFISPTTDGLDPELLDLVVRLDADLAVLDPGYRIAQIKIKFEDDFRYYTVSSPDLSPEASAQCQRLISQAQRAAFYLLGGIDEEDDEQDDEQDEDE